jgi:hypothetical protein
MTDREKLVDLELIASGKKQIIKPGSHFIFTLNVLCEMNKLTKDTTGIIMRFCYELLAGDKNRRMDLEAYGYASKVFKFKLPELLEAPNRIISFFEVPAPQRRRVSLDVCLDNKINMVRFDGRIKGILLFSRAFSVDVLVLLAAIAPHSNLHNNSSHSDLRNNSSHSTVSIPSDFDYDSHHVYVTDIGIELHTLNTLLFLYDNIYMHSRVT